MRDREKRIKKHKCYIKIEELITVKGRERVKGNRKVQNQSQISKRNTPYINKIYLKLICSVIDECVNVA